MFIKQYQVGNGITHQVELSENILLKLKVVVDDACRRESPIHTCCGCVRAKFLGRLQISNEEPPDFETGLLEEFRMRKLQPRILQLMLEGVTDLYYLGVKVISRQRRDNVWFHELTYDYNSN